MPFMKIKAGADVIAFVQAVVAGILMSRSVLHIIKFTYATIVVRPSKQRLCITAERNLKEVASLDFALLRAADCTSDDKDVFKAYFSIAYDSFIRMLDFAKQSQDKEFFKGKVEHLIEALATQNINL